MAKENKSKTASKLYRLYELQRELDSGKDQYEKMLPQYKALVEKLKADDNEAFVKQVVNQFETDAKSIQTGLENIQKRQWALNLILSKADESEESKTVVDWFVTMIFTALGIDLNDTAITDPNLVKKSTLFTKIDIFSVLSSLA